MQQLTIDDWVKKLAAIPEDEFTIQNVCDFTAHNAIQPETLAPYLFYAKNHYTRNLIFKNNLFEVLAICWNVGQVSRIHNHRDQNCWMVTPIGRLRVQNFRVEDRDSNSGNCKLVPTDAYEMDPTHPAFVEPEEPVHQVQNLQNTTSEPPAFTFILTLLNLRSLFARKRRLRRRPAHYSSEYGKLSPDEKLS